MNTPTASLRGNKAVLLSWILGLFLITLIAGAGLAGSDSGGALVRTSDLQLGITPALALYGTPFSMRITGLAPGGQVTVKAQSTDQKKIIWESSAVFAAGDSGVVDVAVQAPISGSYSGADIFGLLWSMQPLNPPGKKKIGYREDETSGCVVDFSATDSTGRIASARLERVFQMPDRKLARVSLEKDDLRGCLFYPEQGGPFPGVLILAGSGGGIYEWLAQAFASNGFAALNLAYFNYKDLPPELVEIPVEYFQRALAWMKTQPSVKPDRIAVAGGSKGGETDDQTWPADRSCRNIVAKLKKGGFPYELKHISHPGGGHMSFLPSLITANRGGGVSSGSPQADARAGFISWEETLLFLHRHLDR